MLIHNYVPGNSGRMKKWRKLKKENVKTHNRNQYLKSKSKITKQPLDTKIKPATQRKRAERLRKAEQKERQAEIRRKDVLRKREKNHVSNRHYSSSTPNIIIHETFKNRMEKSRAIASLKRALPKSPQKRAARTIKISNH